MRRPASPLLYVGAAIYVFIALMPFVWMLDSSIKSQPDLFTVPPHWIPTAPTWASYAKVLFSSNIPRYFINSCVIALGSTALALVLAICAAYGFARFQFPGKRILQSSILVAQLLPTATIIVPLYVALSSFGLVNTYFGLILVYLIITLPLCVWMLIGYFRAIPIDLEEAALIDGASRLTILVRILLPLSIPGLAAVVVYSFVATWNEFIFALVFASDSSVKTLPIGLSEFSSEFNTDWGAVMAASAVMTIPIAILFLAMQNLFIAGLTSGATKG